jgi:hypothetical protein
MFDSGWIWIFIAFFFIWGPMRRFRWGRGRGRWDRWGTDGQDGAPQDRQRPSKEDLEKQQRRDEQVEQLEARVNELESRLDFAERLLAPRREQVVVPRNGSD